jgi:glycosyltransferase involved in cell wall biosynthesis
MLTGGLLAPSAWAATVLRRSFPGVPVVVAPHGVSPEIHRPVPADRNVVRIAHGLGQFNVLHMTSSDTARKGTKLLLSAWRQAKRGEQIPPQSKLFITMNPLHMNKLRWWCSEFNLTEQDVLVMPGLAYDQAGVAAMYRTMHAVCQPSRGEGFGLVPLEALACGVPVIATMCTGHSEWLLPGLPGAVVVPHGSDAPMDDFAGSVAPTVTASAIADALGRAYANWSALADAAETHASALGAEWSWEAKNVPAIRRMIKETEEK